MTVDTSGAASALAASGEAVVEGANTRDGSSDPTLPAMDVPSADPDTAPASDVPEGSGTDIPTVSGDSTEVGPAPTFIPAAVANATVPDTVAPDVDVAPSDSSPGNDVIKADTADDVLARIETRVTSIEQRVTDFKTDIINELIERLGELEGNTFAKMLLPMISALKG